LQKITGYLRGETKKPHGVDEKMVEPMIPIGAGIAFGLGALGTGIAQARIGAAGAGVIAEKPELFGLALVFVALPETLVILGFVIAAIILFVLV
jgi:V/A-type H+-transporting ATPase subunit K